MEKIFVALSLLFMLLGTVLWKREETNPLAHNLVSFFGLVVIICTMFFVPLIVDITIGLAIAISLIVSISRVSKVFYFMKLFVQLVLILEFVAILVN